MPEDDEGDDADEQPQRKESVCVILKNKSVVAWMRQPEIAKLRDANITLGDPFTILVGPKNHGFRTGMKLQYTANQFLEALGFEERYPEDTKENK